MVLPTGSEAVVDGEKHRYHSDRVIDERIHQQLIYKDNRIVDLNNVILDKERQILDLQERVKEQGEVANVKNQAIRIVQQKFEEMHKERKDMATETDNTTLLSLPSVSSHSATFLKSEKHERRTRSSSPGHAIARKVTQTFSPPPVDPPTEKDVETDIAFETLRHLDVDGIRKKNRKRVTFDLRQPSSNLQGESVELAFALTEASSENTFLRKQIEELNESVEKMKEQYEQELAKCSREAKSCGLKARVVATARIRELEKTLEESNAEHSNEIERLQAEVDTLRSSREWELEQNGQLREQISQFRERIHKLTEELDVSEHAKRSLDDEMQEAKKIIDLMSEDLSNAESAIEFHQNQKTAIFEDIDRLKEAIQAQDCFIEVLEADIVIYEEHIGLLRESLGASKVDHRALIKSKAFETKLLALEKEKEMINRKSTEERLRTKAFNKKCRLLELENEKLMGKLCELEMQRGDFSPEKMAQMKAQIDELSQKLADQQSLNVVVQQGNEQENGKEDTENETADIFNEQIERLREELTKSIQEAENMRAENFDLQMMYQNARDERDKDFAATAKRQQELQEAKAKLEGKVEELDEACDEILRLKKDRERMRSELENAKLEILDANQIRDEVNQLKEELKHQRETERKNWEDTCRRSEDKSSSKNSKEVQYDEKVERLQKELDEARIVIASSKEEKKKLKQALKQMRDKESGLKEASHQKVHSEVQQSAPASETASRSTETDPIADQEVADLGRNFEELKLEAKLSEELNIELGRAMLEMERQIDLLHAERDSNDKETDAIKAELRLHEMMVEDLSKEIEDLKKASSEVQERSSRECTPLKVVIQDLRIENDQLRQETQLILQKIADVEVARSTEREALESMHDSEVRHLRISIEDARREISDLEEKLIISEEALEKKIAAVVASDAVVEEDPAALDCATSNATLQQAVDGREDLQTLDTLVEENELLRNFVADTNRSHEGISEDVNKLLELKEELETAVSSLQAEIWSLNGQLKATVIDRENMEDRICDLEHIVEKEKKRADGLDVDLQEQVEMTERAQRRAAEAENESNRRLAECLDMETRREEIEKAYANLTDYYNQLQSAYNVLYATVHAGQNREETTPCRSQTTADDDSTMTCQVEDVLKQLLPILEIECQPNCDLAQKLKLITNKVRVVVEQVRELSTSLGEQKTISAAVQERLESLEASCDREAYASSVQRVEQLEGELEWKDEECTSLNRRIKELEKALDCIASRANEEETAKLATRQADVDSLFRTNAELAHTNVQLQNDVDERDERLVESVRVHNEELEKLRSQVDDLEFQIEDLQHQLSESAKEQPQPDFPLEVAITNELGVEEEVADNWGWGEDEAEDAGEVKKEDEGAAAPETDEVQRLQGVERILNNRILCLEDQFLELEEKLQDCEEQLADERMEKQKACEAQSSPTDNGESEIVENLQIEIQRMTSMLAECNVSLENASKERELLTFERDNVQAASKELAEDVERLNAECEKVSQALNECKRNLKSSEQEKVYLIDKEEYAQEEILELRNRLSAFEGAQQVEEAKETCEPVENAWDDDDWGEPQETQPSPSDAETIQLKEKLESFERKLAEAEKNYSAAMVQLEQKEREQQDLDALLINLQNENDRRLREQATILRARDEDLRRALSHMIMLRNRLNTLEADAQKKMEEAISQIPVLPNQNEDTDNNLSPEERVASSNERYHNMIDRLNAAVSVLHACLVNASETIKELRKRLNESDRNDGEQRRTQEELIEKLTGEAKRNASELEKLREQNNLLKDSESRLLDQADDYASKMEGYLERCKKLEEELQCSETKAANDLAKSDVTAANAKRVDCEKKRLTVELNNTRESLLLMEKERDSARKELAEVRAKYSGRLPFVVGPPISQRIFAPAFDGIGSEETTAGTSTAPEKSSSQFLTSGTAFQPVLPQENRPLYWTSIDNFVQKVSAFLDSQEARSQFVCRQFEEMARKNRKAKKTVAQPVETGELGADSNRNEISAITKEPNFSAGFEVEDASEQESLGKMYEEMQGIVAEHNDFVRQLADYEERSRRAEEAIKERFSNEIEMLKYNIATSEGDIARLEEEKRRDQDEISALKGMLAQEQNMSDELVAKCNHHYKQEIETEDEVAALTDALWHAENNMKDLDKDFASFRQGSMEKLAVAELCAKQLAVEEEAKEAVEASCASLREELDELTEEKNSLKKSLTRRQQEKDDLENLCSALRKKSNDALKVLTEMEANCVQKTFENEELRKESQILAVELEELKRRADVHSATIQRAAEDEKLREQADSAIASLAESISLHQNCEGTLERAGEQLNLNSEQLREVIRKNEAYLAKCEQLAQAVDEKNTRIVILESQLEQESLKSSTQLLGASGEPKGEVISHLKLDNVRLERELFSAHETMDSLRSEIGDLHHIMEIKEVSLKEANLEVSRCVKAVKAAQMEKEHALRAGNTTEAAKKVLELERRVADQAADHNEKLEATLEELRTCEEQLKLTQERYASSMENEQQMQILMHNWRQRFEDAASENETLCRQIEEVRNLEDALRNAREENERLSKSLQKALDECCRLTEDKDVFRQQISQLTDLLNQRTERLLHASESKMEHTKKIVQLESRLASALQNTCVNETQTAENGVPQFESDDVDREKIDDIKTFEEGPMCKVDVEQGCDEFVSASSVLVSATSPFPSLQYKVSRKLRAWKHQHNLAFFPYFRYLFLMNIFPSNSFSFSFVGLDATNRLSRAQRLQKENECSNLETIYRLILRSFLENAMKNGNRFIEGDSPMLTDILLLLERIVAHGFLASANTALISLKSPEAELWAAIMRISKIDADMNESTTCADNISTLLTPITKLRAFLRMTIMQKKLSEYFEVLVTSPFIREFYSPWAFLRQERAAVLCGHLVSIRAVDCDLCIDFDHLQEQPLNLDLSLYVKQSILGAADERKEDESALEKERRMIVDQNHYLEERNKQLQTNLDALRKKVVPPEPTLSPNIENDEFSFRNLVQKDALSAVPTDPSVTMAAKEKELADENASLVAKISELEDTVELLKTQVADKTKITVDLYQKLRLSEECIRKLENDFICLKERSDVDRQRLLDTIDRLETQCKDLAEEMNARVSSGDSTRQELKKKCEQYSNMITILEQKQRELAKALEDNEQLQRDLTAAQRESKEVPFLKEELKELETQLSTEKVRVEQFEKTLEEVGGHLSQSKLRMVELTEELLPLTDAHWINDADVTACTTCNEKFTITNRKHHCRNCGAIFCSTCSESRVKLPSNPNPVRVCDICFGILIARNSSQ